MFVVNKIYGLDFHIRFRLGRFWNETIHLSFCCKLLQPPAQKNKLWLNTIRHTVIVAAVGCKPQISKIVGLWRKEYFLKSSTVFPKFQNPSLKGHETWDSFASKHDHVNSDTTSCGLLATTALLVQPLPTWLLYQRHCVQGGTCSKRRTDDSVWGLCGELAQAHCHCWQGEKAGRGVLNVKASVIDFK